MCRRAVKQKWNQTKAPDREVQQTLIDISFEHGPSQVQNQLTRQDNIIDLIFTDDPSLVKYSRSITGINDHAMVVADADVKPIYNKQKPRKFYQFSKANWEKIYIAREKLPKEIVGMVHEQLKVERIWHKFKTEIQTAMDSFIPSKMFKKNNSVPWFNRNLKRMTKRKARLYRHEKKNLNNRLK